ncbi:MAG: MFS transporter [Spirochaetes bacterium]|nr:MFS transporter [Spirochaetota bacterium]
MKAASPAELKEKRQCVLGRRISHVEAFVQTIGISMGGIFAPNFVLAGMLINVMHAGNVLIGFTNAIPALIGPLQLITNIIAGRVSRRKPLVLVSSLMGRSLFIIAIFIGMFGTFVHRDALFLTLLVIAAFAMAFTPSAWGAWMADIVPENIRGNYFALRNAFAGAASIIGILVAGMLLTALPGKTGFTVIYAVALGAALLGAFVLLAQHEPKNAVSVHTSVGAAYRTILRDKNFLTFTGMVVFINTALTVAGPFYSVHFLTHLAMPYGTFALAAAISAVAAIAGFIFFGKLSDIIGNRPVIRLCFAALIIPALLCILATRETALAFVIPALCVNAFFNSGLMLAVFNTSLAVSPRDERLTYLGVFTGVTAFAAIVAPPVGGFIIDLYQHHPVAFFSFTFPGTSVIFAVSMVLILIGLIIFPSYRDSDRSIELSARDIFRPDFAAALYHLFIASFLPYIPQRSKLAEDIGDTKSPATVTTLAKLLGDVDPDVRLSAIEGLGTVGGRFAQRILFAHYADAPLLEKKEIVRALRCIPNEETKQFLIDMLDVKDQLLRAETIRSLSAMTDVEVKDTVLARITKERDADMFILYLEILARYHVIEIVPIVLARYAATSSPQRKNNMLYQMAVMLNIRDDYYHFASIATEDARLARLGDYTRRIAKLLRQSKQGHEDYSIRDMIAGFEIELRAFVEDSAAVTLRPLRKQFRSLVTRVTTNPNKDILAFIDYFLNKRVMNNNETALFFLEIIAYLRIRSRIG